MPEFDAAQSRVLREVVSRFERRVEKTLREPLREQLGGYSPPELDRLLEEVSLVAKQLRVAGDMAGVHDVHVKLLKAMILRERRTMALESEEPRQRTSNAAAIRFLLRNIQVLDRILAEGWCIDLEPLPQPKLTDYLSIRHAESALARDWPLLERAWDEKFSILTAPRLVIPDLAHYRTHCALRGSTVCVAFADIDDFKSYNTAHGETLVDRDLLPAFMQALEAHVYAHGHAYRFGGDEYVILLPNQTRVGAMVFLGELQDRLRHLQLAGVSRTPTISVGVCHLPPDAFLTDREALERANWAKDFAKVRGKNRIAWFDGHTYQQTDLRCDG